MEHMDPKNLDQNVHMMTRREEEEKVTSDSEHQVHTIQERNRRRLVLVSQHQDAESQVSNHKADTDSIA